VFTRRSGYPTPSGFRILLVWGIGAALLLGLVEPLTKFLLPMLAFSINTAQSDFAVHLQYDSHDSDADIRMVCTTLHSVAFGRKVIASRADFDGGSMHAVHLIAPLLLVLVITGSWPATTRSEILARVGFGTVFGLPSALLPAAILLMGRVYAALESASRTGDSSGVWAQIVVFSELGGLWLVPLLAGSLAVMLARETAGTSKPVG